MGTVYGLPGRAPAVRPSPVFLGIFAVFVATAALTWRAGVWPVQSGRLAVFGFVAAGWVISLCLHEFGHAYFAWRSGDHSVATRGYLTLNPLKYADISLSLLMPLLFMLLGGIGLPGGAVYIDRGAIRSKLRNSLISAAGPLANLVFAIALALAVGNLATRSHLTFWAALSFLAFLQVTAALLNLLPLPGLDGFGIWEPFLPRAWVAQAQRVGGYAFLALLLLLWIPPVNDVFFDGIFHVTDLFGLDQSGISYGLHFFRFWEK